MDHSRTMSCHVVQAPWNSFLSRSDLPTKTRSCSTQLSLAWSRSGWCGIHRHRFPADPQNKMYDIHVVTLAFRLHVDTKGG